MTTWTVARQAPLSMGFSRQESWSGLTCPPPGDLPDPGVKLTSLMSSVLEGSSLPLMPLGKPLGDGDEITNYEGGESNCQDCYLCWEMTGLPRWYSGKESTCQCRKRGFPWVGKIPWRRKRQPTPLFLPRKSHGQRSLQDTVHGLTKSWT